MHEGLYTSTSWGTFMAMELVIMGHPSFHIEGNVTIELPSYMNILPVEELEEARDAANRDGLILAAGRRPNLEDIVFLTGAGELMEINIEEHGFPNVPVEPIDFGQTIRFNLTGSFEVSNTFLIEHARSVMFLGAMVSNEGCRVSFDDVSYVDL